MSLVSVHILRFGPSTTARFYRDTHDFRSVDFDIGVPLPKSHIHNVFEPVNVIRVDNGQTEEKGQVACFRVYVQGNSATQGKGEMGLDGTSRARVAEVRMFWTR